MYCLYQWQIIKLANRGDKRHDKMHQCFISFSDELNTLYSPNEGGMNKVNICFQIVNRINIAELWTKQFWGKKVWIIVEEFEFLFYSISRKFMKLILLHCTKYLFGCKFIWKGTKYLKVSWKNDKQNSFRFLECQFLKFF